MSKLPIFKLAERGQDAQLLIDSLQAQFVVMVLFEEGKLLYTQSIPARIMLRGIVDSDPRVTPGYIYEEGINWLISQGLMEVTLTEKGRELIKRDLI